MTTTKPIAEQVGELKVGDWVEARFEYEYGSATYTGRIEIMSHSVFIRLDGTSVQNIAVNNGVPVPYLTSITRVPRPIPSEPEGGCFALTGTDVVANTVEDSPGIWRGILDNGPKSWPEIYPHIVKLYTPSGDLVTGFEYATEKES